MIQDRLGNNGKIRDEFRLNFVQQKSSKKIEDFNLFSQVG